MERLSRTAGAVFKPHGEYGEMLSITLQRRTYDYLLIQQVCSWESAELLGITNCQPLGTHENGPFM